MLVGAGDIFDEAEPEGVVQWLISRANGKCVVLVRGNHDLYTRCDGDKRTISDISRQMRAEAARQNDAANADIVHVLDADEPVCWIGNVRFVGMTLWSDWIGAGRWAPNQVQRPALAWAAQARAVAGHWRDGRCRPRDEAAANTYHRCMGRLRSNLEHKQ